MSTRKIFFERKKIFKHVRSYKSCKENNAVFIDLILMEILYVFMNIFRDDE